jgi:hypothetical protein
MNAERILIASECLGDARFFIRRAADYAKERVVFGRPIGQNQGVAFPIARAHAETIAAELVVRKATAMFEAKRDCGAEANMGKMLAADAAWHAAEACLQTFGGFGFAREYGIERKWRETRLYQTAPISTNMVLAYVAQHVLGLPRLVLSASRPLSCKGSKSLPKSRKTGDGDDAYADAGLPFHVRLGLRLRNGQIGADDRSHAGKSEPDVQQAGLFDIAHVAHDERGEDAATEPADQIRIAGNLLQLVIHSLLPEPGH